MKESLCNSGLYVALDFSLSLFLRVLTRKRGTYRIIKIREYGGHDWFLTKTYRRNLPHWELKGSTYFVTIRVSSEAGFPFSDSRLAQLMMAFLIKDHEKRYLLYAYVIMPDHLHLILKPIQGVSLSEILKRMKGASALELNKMMQRSGKFWQTENFDHLIRNNLSLREKWEYIKDNPVNANLVKSAQDYPFSSFYCGLKPAKTSSD